jgi:hypothetical protein
MTSTIRSSSRRRSLRREELADLLALALGHELDVALLLAPRQLTLLRLGSRAKVVARRHAEPVGDEVRDADDDHDARAQVRSLDTGHDRGGRDGAVDRAVDEVAQIAGPWRRGQAPAHRCGCALGWSAAVRGGLRHRAVKCDRRRAKRAGHCARHDAGSRPGGHARRSAVSRARSAAWRCRRGAMPGGCFEAISGWDNLVNFVIPMTSVPGSRSCSCASASCATCGGVCRRSCSGSEACAPGNTLSIATGSCA